MRRPQPGMERVRHHYGQLLSARDLRDDFQRETQLRWWHTVGLHNTWGIAMGLDVEVAGRGVMVAPGLAYDRLGRELILAEETAINMPEEGWRDPRPTEWVLVAGYDLGTDSIRRREFVFGCPGDDKISNRDQLVFAWRHPDQVRLGFQVPLAKILLSSVSMGIDLRVRRYAQSLRRPCIAVGRTPQGSVWQPFQHFGDNAPLVGWWIDVDTSSAGFGDTPHYFAWLASSPLEEGSDLASRLLGPFSIILARAADRFIFAVMFATSDGANDLQDLERAFGESGAAPAVDWMAIERVLPC